MLSRFENGQSELSGQKLLALSAPSHRNRRIYPCSRHPGSSFSQGTLKAHIQDLLQTNQLDLLEELLSGKKKKITQKSKPASLIGLSA